MNGETASCVLDSHAILAYLGGETGGDKVSELLKEAKKGSCELFLSWINLGEVLYIIERRRGLRETLSTLGLLQQLPVHLVEVTYEGILSAAHIKANHPIAYADAFAVAAAQEREAALVTGDPELNSISDLVEIVWIKD